MKYATPIICTILVCATLIYISYMHISPYRYEHTGDRLIRIDNHSDKTWLYRSVNGVYQWMEQHIQQ